MKPEEQNDTPEFDEEEREDMLEDDEITNLEEGVLQGYEEGKTMDSCANCGQAIIDEDFVEEKIEGKIHRFCSTECADEFEERKV